MIMTEEPSNLLPLDSWRKFFGWNPWSFWGLRSDTGAAALRSECLDVVTEYAWQADQAVGRDDIRNSIIAAEQMAREWTGFWPAPRYGETSLPYPTLATGRDRRWQAQPNWRQMGINLNEMKLIRLGVQKREPVDLTAALVYSDPDGDGIDELFTITVTVPANTSVDQVAVYFTEADRPENQDISERWRILPLTVRINTTTWVATITGRSWLVVRPELYENMTDEGLDAKDPATFIEEASVYLRFTDPTGTTVDTAMATLSWENRPFHGWWCCCGGCSALNSQGDPAATSTTLARGGIRYADPGVVYIAQAAYNSDTGFWYDSPITNCWQPDSVRVRWLAGVPLGGNGIMQSDWARVISRLAASDLTRPICACDSANKALYWWQFDLATATAEAEQYQIGPADLENPIGTRRGHVQAWKWFSRQEVTVGFLPG
jgi:hypothetical protein